MVSGSTIISPCNLQNRSSYNLIMDSRYPKIEEISLKPAIRVAVTGAAGLIGSYLCPMIA